MNQPLYHLCRLILVGSVLLAAGPLRAATTWTWTGANSVSWNDPLNWDQASVPGVAPNAGVDVDIANVGNQPVLDVTASVGSLTVRGGRTLTTSGAVNLTAAGNLTVEAGAVMDMAARTLTVNGATTTVDGTLQRTSGTVTLNSLVVGASGVFSGTTGATTVKGDWTRTGTFTPGTGTVTFSGTTGVQTMTPETFYSLTVNNANGVSSTGDLNVQGNLTVSAGTTFTINSGSGTINLTGTPAVNLTGSATSTISGNVTINKGAVATTVTLGAGGIDITGVLTVTQGRLSQGAAGRQIRNLTSASVDTTGGLVVYDNGTPLASASFLSAVPTLATPINYYQLISISADTVIEPTSIGAGGLMLGATANTVKFTLSGDTTVAGPVTLSAGILDTKDANTSTDHNFTTTGAGGSFTMSDGTIGTAFNANGSAVDISGAVAVGRKGTFNAMSGNIVLRGVLTINGQNTATQLQGGFNVGTATVTVTGAVTVGGGATSATSEGQGALLNVGSGTFAALGALTANGGIVNAAQGGANQAFGGSVTVDAGGTLSVGTALAVGGGSVSANALASSTANGASLSVAATGSLTIGTTLTVSGGTLNATGLTSCIANGGTMMVANGGGLVLGTSLAVAGGTVGNGTTTSSTANGGTLTLGTGGTDLTLTTTLAVSGGTNAGTGNTAGGGTLSLGSRNLTVTGTFTVAAGLGTPIGNGGSFSVTTATVNLKSTLTIGSNGTLTPGTGTFNFTSTGATTHTISGSATLYDLNVSSTTSTVQLAAGAAVSVSHGLNVSAGVYDQTAAGRITTGTGTTPLLVGATARLRLYETGTTPFATAFPGFTKPTTAAGGGNGNLSSGSTVDFASATTGTTIDMVSFHDLILSGTAAFTLGGASTVEGNFTASNGSLVTGDNNLTVAGNLNLGTRPLTAGTGNIISVGGNFVHTGTLTANTSTFVFNGSGAQAVAAHSAASSYYNLQVNPGSIATAAGSIATFGTLAVNGSLTFTTASTLTVGTGLSVGGSLSMASGLVTVTSGGLTLGGTLTSTSGGVTVTAGGVTVNGGGQLTLTAGALTVNGGDTTINALGTVNLNNSAHTVQNLTITGTLNHNPTAASILAVKGNWAQTGTFTPSTFSTVSFTGTSAQTISTANFYHLTINNGAGGSVTLGGDITIAGNLALTALTAGSFSDGGKTITLTGNITGTGSVFNAATGTMVFDGACSIITGLTLNNVTINSGKSLTFTTAASTLAVKGNWSRAGTFTHNTSTITFNGSANQGIDSSAFNAVTVSNTGTTPNNVVTLQGGTTIAGAFILNSGELRTTAGGSVALTGTAVLNGGSLILDGGQTFGGGTTLTMNSGALINLDEDGTGTGATVTFTSTGTLNNTTSITVGGGTLSGLTTLTLNNTSSISLSSGGSLTSTGLLTLAGGSTVTVGAGSLTTGGITLGSTAVPAVAVTTGAVDVNGTLTINNTGGTFAFTGAGSLSISNNLTLGAGASATKFVAGASTVTFDGAVAQTTSAGFALNNLLVKYTSGTPLVTLTPGGALTVNGNLTVEGQRSLVMGANNLIVEGNTTLSGTLSFSTSIGSRLGSSPPDGDTVTINNGGVLTKTSTGTLAINADVTVNNGGQVTFTSTGGMAVTGNLANYGMLDLGSSVSSVSGNATNGDVGGSDVGTIQLTTGTLTVSGNLVNNANSIIDISSTGTLNVEGTFTNAGTFNAGTGTMTVTGGDGTIITAGNYFNLTVNLNNATDTAVPSGPLSVKGTFTMLKGNVNLDGRSLSVSNMTLSGTSGAATPADTLLASNSVVTVTNNLVVNNTAILAVQDSTFTVGGTATVNNSGTIKGDDLADSVNGSFSVVGALTLNNSAVVSAGSADSPTMNVGGALTLNTGTTFNGENATITLNNNLVLSGLAFNAGSSRITLAGNVTGTAAVLHGDTGTFVFNGTTAQTILTGIVFNDVEVNTTAPGYLNLTTGTYGMRNLTISSGSTNQITSGTMNISGDLNIQSGGTLNVTTTGILNVGGNWTDNGSFNKGTGGTVVLNGTGAQSIGTEAFHHLTVNKTAGTATLNGGTTLAGNFVLTQGTVNVSGAVTVTGTATLNGGSLNLDTGNSFTVTTSTLTLNNASGITVGAGTLTVGSTLTLNGTSSITVSTGLLDANGTVSLTTGAGLSLTGGGTVDTAINLTLAGTSSLSVQAGAFNVGGYVRLYDTSAIAVGAGTLNVTGAFTVGYSPAGSTSSLTVDSGSVVVNGTLTLNYATSLTVNTGLVDANGALTMNSDSTLTITGTGRVDVLGTLTLNSASQLTVGTGQLWAGNLTQAGTSVLHADTSPSLIVTNNLTVGNGSFFYGDTSQNIAISNLTLSASVPTTAALVAGSSKITVIGSVTAGNGAQLDGGTGTFIFNGTTLQSIVAGMTNFNTVILTNVGSYVSFGNGTVGVGNLTIATNTVARLAGTSSTTPPVLEARGAVVLAGELAATTGALVPTYGKLKVGGNFTIPLGGIYTPGNGTVEFSGATNSAININIGTTNQFKNLLVNKAVTNALVTLTTTVNINGTLTVTSGIYDQTVAGRVTTYTGAGLGNLTVGAGGTLRLRKAGTAAPLPFDDAFLNFTKPQNAISGGNNRLLPGSTIEYASVTTPTTIDMDKPYHLRLTGTAAFSLGSATVVAGDLVATSGSLNTDIYNLTVAGTLSMGTRVLTANASTINVGGNYVHTGTSSLVAGTSTFVFNGTGAQTIASRTGASSFYNLTVSAGSISTAASSIAANGTVIANGSLTFLTTATLTVANGVAVGATTGSLAMTSGALTVNGGGITVNSGGNLALASGALIVNSGDSTFAGTVSLGTSASHVLQAVNLTGALSATSGTINVKGDWTQTGGTFAGGTSTVVLSGTAAQSVTSGTFFNLTVNNNSAAPLPSIMLGTGTTVGGAFTLTTGTVDVNGTVTITGASTLTGTLPGSILLDSSDNLVAAAVTLGGSSSITIGGGGVLNAGLTVTRNGTSSINLVSGELHAGALTLGGTAPGTSVTVTSGWVDVNGALSFVNANGSLTFLGAGSLTVGGNMALSGGATGAQFTNGTATVTFDGAGAQSVSSGFTFNQLIVAGTANTVSLGNATAASLTVTSGTLSVGANNLQVSGATTVNGTLTFTTGVLSTLSSLTVNDGGTVNLSSGKVTMTGDVTINGGTPGGAITVSSTGTLDVKGNWIRNGTFNKGTGTVLFSGAGDQAVDATAFHNLNVNNTNATGKVIFASGSTAAGTFVLTAGPVDVNGTHTVTGATTLNGGVLNLVTNATFTATSTMIMNNTNSLLLATNAVFTATGAVTLNNASQITLASNATFNASSTVAMNNASRVALDTNATFAATSTVTLSGLSQVAVPTGTLRAGALTLTGTTTNAPAISVGTGTVDVNGALTFTGIGGTLTFTNAGNLFIAGGLTLGSGAGPGQLAAGDSSTVTFDGTADQTIGALSGVGFTFQNLVIANTAAAPTNDVILSGTNTVNGNLTVTGGNLNVGAYQLTVAGTTTLSGADATHLGTLSFSTGTASTLNTVNVNGYGLLTISSSGTVMVTNDVTVLTNGAITLTSATTPGTFKMTGNHTLNNQGDITFGVNKLDITGTVINGDVPGTNPGHITFTTGNFLVAGEVTNNLNSTISFTTGTVNVTAGAGTGSVSNSGTITYTTGSITVAGNLDNTSTGTIGISGTGTLNVAGTFTNAGTFNKGSSTVIITGGDGTLINPADYFNLTINLAHAADTAQLSGNLTVGGTFTMLQGNVDLNAKNLTVGNMVLNGDEGSTVAPLADTLFASNGVVQVLTNLTVANEAILEVQDSTFTVTGTATVSNNGVINGDAVPNADSGSFSVTGAMTLNNFAEVNAGSADSPTMSIGGALTLNTGTTFKGEIATVSLAGNLAGAFGSLNAGSSTFVFNGTAAQTVIAGVTFHDVQVSTTGSGYVSFGAGTFTLNDLTIDAGGLLRLISNSAILNINGNAVINGELASQTAALASTTGRINLAGNWTMGGTDAFTRGASTFNVNGSDNQSIGAADFNIFAVNNTGAGLSKVVTLQDQVRIFSTFTLTQGAVDINGTVGVTGAAVIGSTTPTYGSITMGNGDTLNLGTTLTMYDQSSVAVGAGTLTVGSTLTLNGNGVGASSSITVATGGLVDANAAMTLNSASSVTITGTGTVDAFGTVTLNGTAAEASSIDVGSGTLKTGALTLAGAAGPGNPTPAITVGTGLVNATGALTLNNGSTITIAGTTTVPDEATVKATGTMTLNGTLDQASGIDVGSGTLNAGALTIAGAAGGPNPTVSVSTGTVDLVGTLTLSTTASRFTFSGAGQLFVGGSMSLSGGALASQFTAAGSTVTFDGTAAQAISAGFTFNDLIIANTGGTPVTSTVSLSGPTSVVGNLTVTSGILAASTVQLTVNGITSVSGTLSFTTGTASVLKNVTIQPSGTISMTSGTIGVTGNWTRNGAFAAGTGTVVFKGAAQTISAANFYNLTIGVSGTSAPAVSLGGDLVIANNLNLGDGTLSDGGNTISLAGNIAGTPGVFTSPSGTFVFNRGTVGTQTMSVGMTFNHLTVNGTGNTVQLPGDITVNGDIAITSGILDQMAAGRKLLGSTGAVSLGNGGTLVIRESGATPYATMFSGRSVPGSVHANSTVQWICSGATTVDLTTFGNVIFQDGGVNPTYSLSAPTTISGAGAIKTGATLDLVSSGITDNGSLTVESGGILKTGANVIGGSGTFDLQAGGTLQLGHAGGITGSAADGAVQAAGSRTYSVAANYTYNGNAVGAVTGDGLTGAAIFRVANPNGLTLSGNVQVTTDVYLDVDGAKVTTGSNTLTLGPGAGAVVNTASSLRYIIGNLAKKLTGTDGFTFTIGDANTNAFVTVNAATWSSSGTLTASTVSPDHPQLSTSGLVVTNSVNRYWRLLDSAGLAGAYNATFAFAAGERDPGLVPAAGYGRVMVRRYAGGTWNPTTVGARAATSTQVTNEVGFGEFAIGEQGIHHYLVSASSPQTAGAMFPVTVTAVDLLGLNVISNYSTVVTMTSTSDGVSGAAEFDANANGAYGDNATNLVAGVRTFNTRDLVAQTITITATDTNGITGTSAAIVVNPDAPARLAIQTQPPATALLNVPFSPQPVIRVEDQYGNRATQDGTRTITATRNAGSGTLQGATVITANAGLGTFADLKHDTLGTITIDFATTGLAINTVTSSSITVQLPLHTANTGNDFWLAMPGNFNVSTPALSLNITAPRSTTGTISVPGLGYSTSFSVAAGQSTNVALPLGVSVNTTDGVVDLGIHVTGNDELAVFGMNNVTGTSEGYVGLPVPALGMNYVALGYNNGAGISGSQFTIVATEDGTTVSTNSVSIGTTLNQGEVYQFRNTTAASGADVSGIVITANKPIGVYGGHQAANIPLTNGGANHVVDMLPPVEAWGRRYFTVPLATRLNGDTIRVLAAAAATDVYTNGVLATTLGAGQFHELVLSNAVEITASKPVLVGQYEHGRTYDMTTGDPMMMLAAAAEQYLGEYRVVLPALSAFTSYYLNLVSPANGVNSVAVDGVAVGAGNFMPIGSSGYSWARVSVSAGAHRVGGSLPLGVSAYGYASGDSYGYPAGLNVAPVASVASLALTPSTAGPIAIGGQHSVTATVTDGANPLEGVRVDFSVTGNNTRSGYVFSDANGQATYTYTDSSGMQGTDTIVAATGTWTDSATVDWGTPTSPVISGLSSVSGEATSVAGRSVLLSAQFAHSTVSPVTVTWNVDGVPQLSHSVVLAGGPPLTGTDTFTHTYSLGTHDVLVTADAGGGNVSSVAVTVTVVDTTAPVLTVSGANPLIHNLDSAFSDPGATALDAAEGDLSSSVVASGAVDTTQVGTYLRTYTVSDSSGNTGSATRVVRVVDPSIPTSVARGDSSGTNFWLAMPGNYNASTPALALHITSASRTYGTVGIPGLGFSTNFTVNAGAVVTVNLPTGASVNSSGVVTNLGVQVTAVDEVSVYGMNNVTGTSDGYLGLPVDALGTNYIALGYNNGGPISGSQFTIVATENGTTVKTNDVSIGTTLNQGEVYQFRNPAAATSADVSGTSITADKPIGVYGGHQAAYIPYTKGTIDHLVEMLPPVEAWGKRCFTVPLATRLNGDTIRIMASQAGTTVTTNGVSIGTTLGIGQVFEATVSNVVEVVASAPVLVGQYEQGRTYDGGAGDPMMMLVAPVEQHLAENRVVLPALSGYTSFYLNLVSPDAGASTVAVDGVTVGAGNFTPIGTSGYSYARVNVSAGAHRVSGSLPVGVNGYGYAPFESYGFVGGMNLGMVANVASVAVVPSNTNTPLGVVYAAVAMVQDSGNNPVAGVRVDFSVTGQNTRAGFDFTDANGLAGFAYADSSGTPGIDTIQASVGGINGPASNTWVDNQAPTIAGPAPVLIEANSTFGASVTLSSTVGDPNDATVDVTWIVDDGAPAQSHPGVTVGSVDSFTFTYSLGLHYVTNFVSDGVTTVYRSTTVQVVDTTAPTVTLNGVNPDSVALDGTYVDPGATAADVAYGNLTSSITVSGSVDTSTAGTYQLVYSVTDPSGNTETATRVVRVVDPIAAAALPQDSSGTNFWLAMPGNYNASTPALALHITSASRTYGTVGIPGLGFSTNFTVNAGAVVTVNLPTGASVNSSGVVTNLGVQVTAVDEVSVYGMNNVTGTSDGYLGLPVDALGTNYIALGYNNGGPISGSQFTIVATENGTTVKTNDVSIGTTLNQGQVYQFRNPAAATGADVSGTIITADKPVGVYGGHQAAYIPYTKGTIDHLVEMLPPVEAWGKRCFTVPLATRLNGDTIRVLASVDGTTVSTNGGVTTLVTLNRGQVHELIVSNAVEITASAPVLVGQYEQGRTYDGGVGDPMMMLVAPVEQHLAENRVVLPALSGYTSFYLNLVSPDAGVSSVAVDGAAVGAGNFTPIGTSGYSYARVSVSAGAHRVSGSLPVGVNGYGYAPFESYGFVGGMGAGAVATVDSVVLAPPTASKTTNDWHTVVATVTAGGIPVVGVRVDFNVTGQNTRAGFNFTDASGQASVYYQGTGGTGTDTVTASVGTVTATPATVTWGP